jgi:hypothetical protein
MKKFVALVSAMCLAFVFTVGCGETGKKKEDPKKPPVEKKDDPGKTTPPAK